MLYPNNIELPPPRVIGYGLLGIAGLIIGYQIGSEAIEHAQSIRENLSLFQYHAKNHPMTTMGLAMGLTTTLLGGLGNLVEMTWKRMFKRKDSE